MRILLTGTTGFVGKRLVSLLVGRGHELICLQRPGSAIPAGVTPLHGDLARSDSIAALPTIDTVIHLAQSHQYRNFPVAAADIFAVNTMATAHLLDLARRADVQQFILASTASVYSPGNGSCHEEARLQPDNFYAATKLAAETLLHPYARYLRTCALRLFTPYGPGQRKRLIPTLFQRVRESQPVTLDGAAGGLQLSVAYVDDAAATFMAAAEQGWHGTYNVAATEPTCVREIAATIGRLIGVEPVFARTGRTEPPPLIADLQRLSGLCDPRRFRTLEQGLALTVRASRPDDSKTLSCPS
jgi:nucleoside-diphosphate-sugar epimerase